MPILVSTLSGVVIDVGGGLKSWDIPGVKLTNTNNRTIETIRNVIMMFLLVVVGC
jgi:hypothetical protein